MVTSGSNWLSVSGHGTGGRHIGNGRFTMTTRQNNGRNSRTGTVRLDAPGAPTRTITVTQRGAAATLSLSPSAAWTPSHTSNSRTVNVTTNASSWNATSDQRWLSISRIGSNQFVMIASANTTTSDRRATVTVTATGAPTRTITVRQQIRPATLSLSPSGNWSPSHLASGQTVNVSTSASTWNVTSDQRWLGVSRIGSNQFVMTAQANTTTSTRTATVTVTAPGAPTRSIRVSQRARPVTLSISPNGNWSPSHTSNSMTVRVSTSASTWNVSSNQDWLRFSRIGGDQFLLTVQANTTNSVRVGTVIVSAPGAFAQTILVRQEGFQVRVTGVNIAGLTNRTVHVGEHLNLTATIRPSNATNRNVTWETSNSNVASVNSSGRVTGHRAGTATITVRTNDGGHTASIQVTVSSDTLRLSQTTWNAAWRGGRLGVRVSSNRDWTIRSNRY